MTEHGALPRPRAILVDAAGALLDEESFDLLAGVRTFLEGADLPGRPSSSEEIESWLSDLESIVEATRLLGDREFSMADWLQTHLPMPPDDAAVAELAIWIAAAVLRPRPGAREALRAAHALGLRVGILADTPFSGRTVEFELRRQGFDVPLRVVLSSADCGRRKPSSLPFRAALDRLGVTAPETWFVGDASDCDAVAASGLGAVALRLDPDAHSDAHADVRPPQGSAVAPDSRGSRARRVGGWNGVAALLEASSAEDGR